MSGETWTSTPDECGDYVTITPLHDGYVGVAPFADSAVVAPDERRAAATALWGLAPGARLAEVAEDQVVVKRALVENCERHVARQEQRQHRPLLRRLRAALDDQGGGA